MKIRYIAEGVFKTKEQILKAREKEREMSNQERVADTYNKIVKEKIAYLVNEAVKKKGIYPFQVNIFSTGEHYEEVKTSKKEATVRLGTENGRQVIHLSFDYGCFISSNYYVKNRKPCKDININGWVTYDYNLDFRSKLMQKNALKSMITKIKNFAASRGEEILGKENRDICSMIVDGDIVIDEISMYGDQDDVEELNFVICVLLDDDTMENIASKYKRTAFVREINQPDNTNTYKIILERVMKLIDFKVPVNLIVETATANNVTTGAPVAIDTIFPGYETLGDIEEAAGVPGTIANCILSCFESRRDRYAEGLYYDREKIQELARNCTHIMFEFEDTFKGRYTPDKGFILDRAEIPCIKDVVIAADSSKRYYSKFYVDFNFFKNASRYSLSINEYDKDKANMLSFDAYSSVHDENGLARRIKNENGIKPFTVKETFEKTDPEFKNVKTLVNFIETDLLGPAM